MPRPSRWPPAAVSDPIITDTGAVVVKVLEKKARHADEIAAGKQQTKDELMDERRGRFYASYMTKARERMKIQINRSIAQLTGVSAAARLQAGARRQQSHVDRT